MVIHIAPLLLLFVLMIIRLPLKAQVPSASYTLHYNDSLQQQQGERFITNVFILKNLEKDTLALDFELAVTEGWQLISKLKEIVLPPGQDYAVPVSLVPSPNTPSLWMPFHFVVKEKGHTNYKSYIFWCKNFPVLRYRTYLSSSKAQLSGDERIVSIRVYLQNTGNVQGRYKLNFTNGFFSLNKEFLLRLPPGTDSLFHFSFHISNEQWKQLKNQSISVRLSDTTEAMKLMIFEVIKAHTTLKQNKSAWTTLPVELETGTMLNDKYLTYFGVIKGRLKIKENVLFDYSYKSKEMGVYNSIQNDVLNLKLFTPKLTLYGGQITDAKNFVAFGNGLKANYTLKEGEELYFAGTLHNKNFYYKNNQFEAGIRYKLGKIKIDQLLGGNFDLTAKTNSYLNLNSAELLKKDNLFLAVLAGVGIDLPQAARAQRNAPGLALGYDAFYKSGQFELNSGIQKNSMSFPGVNKGFQNQSHSVIWRRQGLYIKAFFQLNQRIFNLFRDSLYNSDFLSYNTQKLGLYSSVKSEKMNLAIGTGQFGQFGTSASNSMDRYKYVEGFYFWQPFKWLKTSFSGFNAFGHLNDKTQTIWINSISGGIYSNRVGITGLYTRNPMIYTDSAGKHFRHYDETKNLTPSLNFSLAKRLYFNVGYTFSQTSYDDHLTSYGTGSIVYVGKHNGLSVNLYAIVPITKSNALSPGLRQQYFTLSLRKKLDIPLLFTRKYFNLKVVPFNDDNNNGKKDEDEKPIMGLPVTINAVPFITGSTGIISYKNISRGNYAMDLTDATGMNGYIPAFGQTQKIKIDKNLLVEVPFKKSRVIFGSISVELDSLSSIKFTPDGIKVTAMDTLGHVFSSLSDATGNFTIHVPAGVYLVSLNPDAFDEKIKPQVMAFTTDLTADETKKVQFIIKQQKRKVRLLKN